MDWDKFRVLVGQTINDIHAAGGDRDRIDVAIRRYLTRGSKLGMSPMVLWDYFAVSSPTIPEHAGYCGYDAEKVIARFEAISAEESSRE